MTKKIYVIIPTIRDLDFLKEWENQFESIHLIIVEDHLKKEIQPPTIRCRSIKHYTQTDIAVDLQEKAWIIPQKSAAIRSYGFWKAWQEKADTIITIDDDCYPYDQDFISAHLENLTLHAPAHWVPTYPFRSSLYTRGFPYEIRNKIPVKLSHGLWSNVPDYDGLTQLITQNRTFERLPEILHVIPQNMYFPMSAMNIAFSAEITVLMYQLLMGEDRGNIKLGYDRFDDIWAGVFAKKVLDHLQWGVVSGSPFVRHDRASNVYTNIKKEATGIEKNEELWQAVDKVALTKRNPIECYIELASKIKFPQEDYFLKLKKAMITWASLFSSGV